MSTLNSKQRSPKGGRCSATLSHFCALGAVRPREEVRITGSPSSLKAGWRVCDFVGSGGASLGNFGMPSFFRGRPTSALGADAALDASLSATLDAAWDASSAAAIDLLDTFDAAVSSVAHLTA